MSDILVKTTLKFERETPGTYVFSNSKDNTPIPTLYVKKSAFEDEPPKRIVVTIREKVAD